MKNNNTYNASNVSIAEAVSNTSGKTSGSKLGSMIALIVGSISLLLNSAAMIFVLPEVASSIALVAATSAGVIAAAITGLGYSKKFSVLENTNIQQ